MTLYRPIKLAVSLQKTNKFGSGPVYGMNRRDDSQLLDTNYAITIENYHVHGKAKLEKRGGQIVDFNTGESTVIPLSAEYRNGYDIVAYGQKVRAYNTTTGSFTNIKTNFSANNGGFTGGRYGDYFFVNNLVDGLWRISRVVNFEAQTGNFTVGLVVTGQSSGATAIVLEIVDNGITGTLTLGSISGTLQDGELITDTSTGSANLDGTVTFAITAVTDAPKAGVFRIIGKRGILINLATDESGYRYSNADTGSNPPFNVWTAGTRYNDAGGGSARNAGVATDAALIGDTVFVGQENGWYAFKITYTDLAGVSSKVDLEVTTQIGFPIWRCLMTEAGLIVMSTSGMWRLRSLGQPNIAFSDQWEHLTDDLGEEFFNDIDMSDTDIVYDAKRGFMYATVAQDSNTNNLVLSVKVDFVGTKQKVKTGATSIFTGWNVLRFMKRDDDNIYATSDLAGIRHKLFSSQKDVNAKIHTEYLQEINFAYTSTFNLAEFDIKGELSPISSLEISFDTFDETNYYEMKRRRYAWTPRYDYSTDVPGWGEAGFGEAGWGGGSTLSGLISDRTGANVKLRMLTRVWLRVESDDEGQHILNWFSMDAVPIRRTRDRQLTKITTS